jgi:hypothetical protein
MPRSRLTPSSLFLSDPATVYPVTLGPSNLSIVDDAYTQSAFPTSSSGASDRVQSRTDASSSADDLRTPIHIV